MPVSAPALSGAVIRVAGQHRAGTVDLLGQHYAHQRMRQRQARQRPAAAGPCQYFIRQTVGAADDAGHILRGRALRLQPVRQPERVELLTVLIQRHHQIARRQPRQDAPGLIRFGHGQLFELELPGAAQAALIVLNGGVDPHRHARTDRDHAQTHGWALPTGLRPGAWRCGAGEAALWRAFWRWASLPRAPLPRAPLRQELWRLPLALPTIARWHRTRARAAA